jgi:hypothetical protein
MNDERLVVAFVGDSILLNDIAQDQNVGDCILARPQLVGIACLFTSIQHERCPLGLSRFRDDRLGVLVKIDVGSANGSLGSGCLRWCRHSGDPSSG